MSTQQPVRIKICGLTRPDDAHLAAALGAWAVGFVFWPGSPRSVSLETARRMMAVLPPVVTSVGVFVNQPIVEVRSIATEVGLGAVQLHGTEPPSYYADLPHRVIKAIGVVDEHALDALDELPPGVTALLDAHDPVRFGGTGRRIDWTVAARAAKRRPIVLSGGLTPDNVADALTVVHPYALDVSSGVESEPGIKEAGRLRALFEAVHQVAPSKQGWEA